MRKLLNIVLSVNLILLVTDCREPFLPDFKTGINDYLVVEGFINVGQKAITKIKLSRVAPLLSTSQVYENGAILFIEDKDGTQFPLQDGNGSYNSDSLELDPTMEYRLMITTSNQSQYISDFTKPKITPEIDSIHWKWTNAGIQMYSASHDTGNNTIYYKWDYKETWEIHSSYVSNYVYSNGFFYVRVQDLYKIYRCWNTALPQDLLIGSTLQFEDDAIDYPIVLFGQYSDRTSVMYSILVEQRALTKGEFDYLELVQKNAKITGSLFDPLPSEIRGNIHSLTNTDEKVIGYVGASTSTFKRHFVSAAEFGVVPPAKCEKRIIKESEWEALFGSGLYLPIDSLAPDAYSGAMKYCMDCRLRGTSDVPDFW